MVNRPTVEVTATDSGTLPAADLPPGTTVYDPGLEHTAFARSAITRVDADEGRLTYRGHDVVALARDSSFGEVARLLVKGPADLSTPDPEWNALIARACRDVDEFPHPALAQGDRPQSAINYVAAGLAMVSATVEAREKDDASDARELDAARLIACVRSLASMAVHGRRLGSASTADDPFALGSLLPGDGPGDELGHRSLGALLILYADHEMAASTTALRVAASAGAGLFASAAAAAATFGGRRHGGASDAVGALFERLATPKAVEAELDRVHRRETRLPGFGHRLHRGHDPRVVAIRAIIADLRARSTPAAGFDAAAHLEERVSADPYFEERGLFPNPDFYAVQLLMAIGFPAAASSAVLAVGRAAGWAAHWLEATSDRESRLLRPRQVYVGP